MQDLRPQTPIKRYNLFELYETSPADWIHNILAAKAIEEYQRKLCDVIYLNDKVAIRACHSVGKTWIMARIALWFLTNYKNSIVITTAPTHRQVQKLLWGELREAYTNASRPLGGRLLDMELKFSDKHYALGFSPKKEAAGGTSEGQKGSSFQGFHSDYVMIIFDEATGVPPDVWIMAQGLLTSGKIVKFIAIANPTTKNCEFYNCFSAPDWAKVKISCFDSPNMIANGLVNMEALEAEIDRLTIMSEEERIHTIQRYKKPVPYLLTAQFVVPFVMKLGVDHPLSLSKVFGEFPKNEDNVWIQFEEVEASQQRETPAKVTGKRLIGVDVARFGEDNTVITELEDYNQTELKTLVKRDIPYITGEVINLINEKPEAEQIVVCVDATGIGAGVYDLLVEAQRENRIPKHVQLVEVHNAASPVLPDEDRDESDAGKDKVKEIKDRYANLKARQWDLLAQDVKSKIKLFNESIYSEEIPTIKFSFDSKGRYIVESKKDYKARTGKPSPDTSDSLALANLGRYVSISFGSFKGHKKAEPIIKQKQRKQQRTGRIKVREY